jgi:hypothetical protein
MNTPIGIPSLLLISGTGRKSGKTSLICKIIAHISASIPVVAIKISPHAHKGDLTDPWCKASDYQIWKETETSSAKDTARMIQAGASEVYYIECTGDGLKEAFMQVYQSLDPSQPIICESGDLRNYFKPALFLLATDPGQIPKPSSLPLIPMADRIYELKDILEGFRAESISFGAGRWKIMEK